MTATIRIPKVFYDDCVECDSPTPVIVKATKAHYFVSLEHADPDFPELDSVGTWADFTSRAEYYADPLGFDEHVMRTIVPSARATLRAIKSPKCREIK